MSKPPKLYGIFLGTNGNILLTRMTSENRETEIRFFTRSQKTETFFPKKTFDGCEIAVIANAYPFKAPGYKNNIASHICGKDVYGNVIILKVNEDGMRCLMKLQRARKIMEEIQDEYLFG